MKLSTILFCFYSILFTSFIHTSQQLVTYQWPNGKLPKGFGEGEGIPKLIKSTAFVGYGKDGDKVEQENQQLVVGLNERFRSFIWAYVMKGGKSRRLDDENVRYLNNIIGTLEAFKYEGGLNSIQNALEEWNYVKTSVLRCMQLAEGKLDISARGKAVGTLSIENMYGPDYEELIKKYINTNSCNVSINQLIDSNQMQTNTLNSDIKTLQDIVEKNEIMKRMIIKLTAAVIILGLGNMLLCIACIMHFYNINFFQTIPN